jgi:hypothetical protein
MLGSSAGKASELTTTPSLTLTAHRRAFRQLDVVTAYLPSGLRTMFNGMFPTGPLVAPAGVIRLPLTRMLEADCDEDPEPHPGENKKHRASTVIIAAIGR